MDNNRRNTYLTFLATVALLIYSLFMVHQEWLAWQMPIAIQRVRELPLLEGEVNALTDFVFDRVKAINQRDTALERRIMALEVQVYILETKQEEHCASDDH